MGAVGEEVGDIAHRLVAAAGGSVEEQVRRASGGGAQFRAAVEHIIPIALDRQELRNVVGYKV